MKKILVLIACVTIAFADKTGTIEGTITAKNTDEPLPAANIILIGEKLGAATDIHGKYFIENVPIGSHDVKVTMVGYKPIINNRVIVKSGRPAVLDVQLEVDVSETEKIVVKPTYFKKTKDAAVSSRNMDYEEIAVQPGGSFDIQRSMQALPSVVSSADTDNEIIVRGGNYGENLFMIDNIEIPNPNHFGWIGTGGGPISAIYMDFVEEVDFIAGAFPAKFGDKASSVLDIHLREGLRDRFHFKADLGMSGVGGNIEGPLPDKKGSYMLAYHKSFLDLIANTWGMTSIPQYWNTQGKLNYDFSPRLKANFFGMFAKDWIEIDSREESYMDEDEDHWYVESRTDQFTLGGSLKKIYNKGYGMITLYGSSHHWDEFTVDADDHSDLWNESDITESKIAAKFDMLYNPYKSNELSAGLYARYNIFDYDYYDDIDTLYYYYPGTDSIIGSTGYVFGKDTFSEESTGKLGGYAQYRHHFGPLFYAMAGVRVDYLEYTNRLYISPRATITYKLTSETDISLAYGRHYQSPTWFELAFNGKKRPLDYYYADQVVIGIDHLFADDIRATAEAYYKRYEDYPIQKSNTTPEPFDQEYYYVNEVEGYAQGIEFFLQKKVKKNFWGTASYSYSIARNKDPRRSFCPDTGECIYNEYPKSFDYGHVATGVLGYRREFMNEEWYKDLQGKFWWEAISWIPGMPSDESEYSVRFRYLGKRPMQQPVYHDTLRTWTIEPDQAYMTGRIPAYSSLDLRLQSRWYSGKFTVFTYIELDNSLNNKNIWYYQYNPDGSIDTIYQRGRMFVGGVIVEF
ncbi:MAG: TonB-dependent receptor [Candidatus Zixiibacteriota bacterium]